jgi:hypothetical protein
LAWDASGDLHSQLRQDINLARVVGLHTPQHRQRAAVECMAACPTGMTNLGRATVLLQGFAAGHK